MKKNIVFCSGGTGGHIFPAITIIKYLEDYCNTNLVTDNRGKKYIKNIKSKITILNIISFRNKNILLNFFAIFKLFISFLYSFFFIIRNKIDIVFGFGGYVSFPFLLAAKILRKKIYLYEPNLVIGRTNKFFFNSCEKIFTKTNNMKFFSENQDIKCVQVGNIIREEIINNFKKNQKNILSEKTIIILGGSQGAKKFGEVIPKSILSIIKKNYKINVIHQVLKEQIQKVKDFYDENNIKSNVFDFHHNISEFLSLSDLAISRCGASTIAELEFMKIPFIAIPYPFATDNHQYENAIYYESRGSCVLLNENELTSTNLVNKLTELLENISNKSVIEAKKNKMFYSEKVNSLEIIKKIILY